VTITETIPDVDPSWTLDSIICTRDSNGDVLLVDTAPSDGEISIDSIQGDGITCTFTNNQDARLTLVKNVTNDKGGAALAGAWTLSAAGTTPLSGTTGVSSVVDPGDYVLSESGGPANYTGGAWN
jgi:hypothetical protein